LLGSSLFITSAVIPLALNASLPGQFIKVTPSFFLRDLFFFVLVYAYLLVILFAIGYLNWLISGGFLTIYIVYVIIVVAQSKKKKAEETNENVRSAALNMQAANFLTVVDAYKSNPDG